MVFESALQGPNAAPWSKAAFDSHVTKQFVYVSDHGAVNYPGAAFYLMQNETLIKL